MTHYLSGRDIVVAMKGRQGTSGKAVVRVVVMVLMALMLVAGLVYGQQVRCTTRQVGVETVTTCTYPDGSRTVERCRQVGAQYRCTTRRG